MSAVAAWQRAWFVALPLLSLAVSVTSPGSAQSAAGASAELARDQAVAELRSLRGKMPPAFDPQPTDPCIGTWDVVDGYGMIEGKITVLRYRSLLVMHEENRTDQQNTIVARMDAHSVYDTEHRDHNILRCTDSTATLQITKRQGSLSHYEIVSARLGTSGPSIRASSNDANQANSNPHGPRIDAEALRTVRLDYPGSALRNHERGLTRVVLKIDAEGRAYDCLVQVSSGSIALDQATCGFAMTRAQFIPATDAAGKPVAGTMDWKINWTLPE